MCLFHTCCATESIPVLRGSSAFRLYVVVPLLGSAWIPLRIVRASHLPDELKSAVWSEVETLNSSTLSMLS